MGKINSGLVFLARFASEPASLSSRRRRATPSFVQRRYPPGSASRRNRSYSSTIATISLKFFQRPNRSGPVNGRKFRVLAEGKPWEGDAGFPQQSIKKCSRFRIIDQSHSYRARLTCSALAPPRVRHTRFGDRLNGAAGPPAAIRNVRSDSGIRHVRHIWALQRHKELYRQALT